MFIFGTLFSIFMVYIIAAVLPAVILLVIIYKQDKIEKEPPQLLIRLLIMGVMAGIAASLLERLGTSIIGIFLSAETTTYVLVLAFLVVAVAEEGMKFILMKTVTWRNPEFNYRFDAIVYAVFVSLGFAAFENILYVMGYGLGVVPLRAVLAIPGHLSFAVFMGYFYGRAKLWFEVGNTQKAVVNLILSYLTAVFLHGFYDSCAMIGTTTAMIIFVIFIIALDISVFMMVRHESRTDGPV